MHGNLTGVNTQTHNPPSQTRPPAKRHATSMRSTKAHCAPSFLPWLGLGSPGVTEKKALGLRSLNGQPLVFHRWVTNDRLAAMVGHQQKSLVSVEGSLLRRWVG